MSKYKIVQSGTYNLAVVTDHGELIATFHSTDRLIPADDAQRFVDALEGYCGFVPRDLVDIMLGDHERVMPIEDAEELFPSLHYLIDQGIEGINGLLSEALEKLVDDYDYDESEDDCESADDYEGSDD